MIPRGRVLGLVPCVAGFALGVVSGLGGPGPRPSRRIEPPRSYPLTDVALHTGVPIQEGRNVVWCATIQIAWDELGRAFRRPGSLALEGTEEAKRAGVALNARPFPAAALDEPSYLAVGGRVRDGVLDRLRDAWTARFPDEPVPAIAASGDDVVTFAALRKDLSFETSFRVHDEPLRFGDRRVPVRAFGMEEGDHASDVTAIARQVVLFLPHPSEGTDAQDAAVVELVPRGQDRILLSALPRGKTLEETWQAARRRVRSGQSHPLRASALLVVPRIAMEMEHHFTEIEGASIGGMPHAPLLEVRQRIGFSLTESGAQLRSEAVMTVGLLDSPPRMVFDGPFLLALIRRGAARPYLLLWIGNEALLDVVERPG